MRTKPRTLSIGRKSGDPVRQAAEEAALRGAGEREAALRADLASAQRATEDRVLFFRVSFFIIA